MDSPPRKPRVPKQTMSPGKRARAEPRTDEEAYSMLSDEQKTYEGFNPNDPTAPRYQNYANYREAMRQKRLKRQADEREKKNYAERQAKMKAEMAEMKRIYEYLKDLDSKGKLDEARRPYMKSLEGEIEDYEMLTDDVVKKAMSSSKFSGRQNICHLQMLRKNDC